MEKIAYILVLRAKSIPQETSTIDPNTVNPVLLRGEVYHIVDFVGDDDTICLKIEGSYSKERINNADALRMIKDGMKAMAMGVKSLTRNIK